LRRNQIKYVLFGAVIGFLGGFTNYPLWYGVKILPYGNILVSLYGVLMSYAIIKHRLLDIKIAITRTALFLFVYSFVLILPFWWGYLLKRTSFWYLPITSAILLASLGPFIYNCLRRGAEGLLLRQQRRYQHTLQRLAKTMTKIRELDRLLRAIAIRVFRIVGAEFLGLYLISQDKDNSPFYLLKYKYFKKYFSLPETIPKTSSLVKALYSQKAPLLVKEFPFPSESLSIPCFRGKLLYGFLLLGPKLNNTMYTEDDLTVFDTLSSQVSLAIENCLFWQEEKIRLAQQEQIRRQRAMDHFSASMAHEIDNPLMAVFFAAEGIKSKIDSFKGRLSSEEEAYLEKKSQRIQKDLARISKLIKSVREFSSQTTGEFSLLIMDEVIEGFLDIVSPQIKYEGIIFNKEIEWGIPVEGNKIHLEEVLVNIFINALHAVKYNKGPKIITLKVYRNSPKSFLIVFQDNGYGIEKALLEDIFLDFVTTKASTEGTGMGLARVRKIVENHGGRIWAESEGKGKGATFYVELPIAEEA